ncbi:DNA-processing protein DprA [Euzebya tangerina]|uniref:DNA-processing protein DprA n=1 Tax=Euzebya tangerina TaxID=591198 RepID=UPI000E315643|nr:DNA-processing protein DprA [Euzebya tangerina]
MTVRSLVRHLVEAEVTPNQIARVRRKLGLDAGPRVVATTLLAQSRHATHAAGDGPATGDSRTLQKATPAPDDYHLLVVGDDMPPLLSQTWEAGGPLWLWCRGQPPPDGPAVAIVGTRRPTSDGLRLARNLAGDLARAGVRVVSGMARGIDQTAHRGALAAGGRTTAVVGTGLDVAYPAGSERLQAEVAASGGVLSEFPPGHGIRQPAQFLARNRILVGLADAVVVIEAGQRSGALNSASWAATFGREVLVVPASPSNRAAAGSLALLVDGAAPVRNARDVLDVIGVTQPSPGTDQSQPRQGRAPQASAPCLADPAVAEVVALLGPTEVSPSELAGACDLPVRQVLVAVSKLEDAGLARQGPGGVAATWQGDAATVR